MRSLKRMPLIHTLVNLRGNARYVVYTEPMFSIPKALYLPFATVYMYALGLSDKQIGLLASVTLLVSVFSAFISGALTDKLGRRHTTFIFDIVSFAIPLTLLTFAQNFWWFFAAAVMTGANYIPIISWTCLMVEDTDRSTIANVYSYVYISGQLAAVFAPFAGLTVLAFGVVPATRVLYGIGAVLIAAKCFILWLYSTETSIGKVRLAESKRESFMKMVLVYGRVIPDLFKSRSLVMCMCFMFIANVTTVITNNFFGLFVTKTAGFPDNALAYFPILRAVIMLMFVVFFHHILYRHSIKVPMVLGFVLYIISQMTLVLMNTPSVPLVIAYIVVEALSYAIVVPGTDTVSAYFIDPARRAQMFSMMTVVNLVAAMPFGYIAGQLSAIDRHLPFMLNAALFLIGLVVAMLSKSLVTAREAHENV